MVSSVVLVAVVAVKVVARVAVKEAVRVAVSVDGAVRAVQEAGEEGQRTGKGAGAGEPRMRVVLGVDDMDDLEAASTSGATGARLEEFVDDIIYV